jgi:phosphoribosylformimino-5-aminoimidazole carboxamide ribotide isomerase
VLEERESSEHAFEVIPAIDLRGGAVVRLAQGRFDRQRVYSTDPAAVARGFARAGARTIHVVDLDAAVSGGGRSTAVLEAIAAAVAGSDRAPRIQAAGGIRDAETAAATLNAGANRVVLGTAALRDPAFVANLVDRHGPDHVAVALDVRDGAAVGDGWVETAGTASLDVAARSLVDAGVTTFIVTAIDRDGLLGGPDLALLRRVLELTGRDVIASGGIASIDDLRRVRDAGCAGAIVGRAIYDGAIDLRDAIAALA